MYKYLIAIIFLFVSNSIVAQQTEASQTSIPFSEVENPPLAKRCKAQWEIPRQKKCTSIFINDFVNRSFNMNTASKLGVKGMVHMEANFVINQLGKVDNINVSGGPQGLNDHLAEILGSLKDFRPGKQQGEAVSVSFNLPVSLYVAQ